MSLIDPIIPYSNQKRIEGILNLKNIILLLANVILLWNLFKIYPLEILETRNVIFKHKNQLIYEVIADKNIPQEIINNSIKKYILLRENWLDKEKENLQNDLILFETETTKSNRLNFENIFKKSINQYQSFERNIKFIKQSIKLTKDTYAVNIEYYDKINGIIQKPKKAEILIKYKFKDSSKNKNIVIQNGAMIDIINYSIDVI